MEAVKNEKDAIKFIENPTIKVEQYVISNDYRLIARIKNPSEKIQKEALNRNLNAINYIKNPSEKIQKYFIDNFEKLEDKDKRAIYAKLKEHDTHLANKVFPFIKKNRR